MMFKNTDNAAETLSEHTGKERGGALVFVDNPKGMPTEDIACWRLCPVEDGWRMDLVSLNADGEEVALSRMWDDFRMSGVTDLLDALVERIGFGPSDKQ
ncbi:MAG: hypothetical protein ABEN55_03950 [Bradymonadaceae bacterium]